MSLQMKIWVEIPKWKCYRGSFQMLSRLIALRYQNDFLSWAHSTGSNLFPIWSIEQDEFIIGKHPSAAEVLQ
jgi:hypothetical protein